MHDGLDSLEQNQCQIISCIVFCFFRGILHDAFSMVFFAETCTKVPRRSAGIVRGMPLVACTMSHVTIARRQVLKRLQHIDGQPVNKKLLNSES